MECEHCLRLKPSPLGGGQASWHYTSAALEDSRERKEDTGRAGPDIKRNPWDPEKEAWEPTPNRG